MEDSGYAYSIAHNIVEKLGDKHALLAVVLACCILTYGGISAFVVTFAIYPIAAALFKRQNTSQKADTRSNLYWCAHLNHDCLTWLPCHS